SRPHSAWLVPRARRHRRDRHCRRQVPTEGGGVMTTEDLRLAARALLGGGFVTGEAATKARRHRRELADMFREQFGWQVIAEDNGPVRLLSQPGAGHVARGLSIRSGRPFNAQRYALLFLVL